MERIRLSLKQQLQLVLPYAYHNIKEQFIIVVPVCLYIMFFQLVVLRYGLAQIGVMTGGIACVFLGLAFFLEGIKIGLVPIGEIVGNTLPKRYSSLVVLLFAFFLGLMASFGEPVLGTLQMAGTHIKQEQAPLLYALLVGEPLYLVFTVGLGVGIAVLIGTLRFIYGWSLKVLILPLVTGAIALTILASSNEVLASAIGLAWDTGAVIVGPVLCPLVLALGVGVCRASGKTSPTMAGFGMVGLVSVVPIAAVVILTFGLYWFGGERFEAPGVGTKKEQAAEKKEAAPKAAAAAGALAALPKSLDFSTYYPKLRQLSIPGSLAYEACTGRLGLLGPEERGLFGAAYAVNAEKRTIEQRAKISPEVRNRLPAVLGKLGVDFSATPSAIVERAYKITVENEAKVKGKITLRDKVDGAAAVAALEVLGRLGYAEKLPLFADSFVLGARAILPIFAFLFVVMLLLRKKGPPLAQIFYSLAFAVLGLCLFFFGLSIGLGSLGNQLGDRIPAAFIDYLPLFPFDSALFPEDLGKVIVILFAVLLGYGATLAEPAFNVLGQQVEDVTQGAFKKNLFGQAVALGVGIGASLGILSLLYDIDLLYLLLPPYVLLAILTFINKEIFVNIAWDGGAVTTGPVTVPLKLAIGLSLSTATGAGEGFGVLALASAYPVLNILLLGLYLSYRQRKEE